MLELSYQSVKQAVSQSVNQSIDRWIRSSVRQAAGIPAAVIFSILMLLKMDILPHNISFQRTETVLPPSLGSITSLFSTGDRFSDGN